MLQVARGRLQEKEKTYNGRVASTIHARNNTCTSNRIVLGDAAELLGGDRFVTGTKSVLNQGFSNFFVLRPHF